MKNNQIKQYIINTWNHKGFQKYFQNTSWMFIGQLSMIISFTVNIWLARYFGPEKFGFINYTLAFVGIFGFLGNLGVSDILIRELVKYPEKRNKLLGTSFILLLSGGILAFTSSFLAVMYYETDPLIRTLIILYSTIFFLSPIDVISAYFQSTLQSKKNAYAQIIGVILVSLFKIFLILNGKGVIWIIFAFILDYIIGAILYIYNYIKSNLSILEWEFDTTILKQFISTSSLLILSTATGYLLLKIDQVMIGYYLNKEAVGIYAAAVKLTEIWYFAPYIITASLFPAIIKSRELKKEIYFQRLNKLFILLFVVAVCISIPITIISPILIKIIYGNSYLASIPILNLYIWSSLGLFVMIGVNKYFIVENKLKSIFFYSAFASIINIILNIILIPKIGINGAAIATLISYSISPIIFLLIYNFKKNDRQ